MLRRLFSQRACRGEFLPFSLRRHRALDDLGPRLSLDSREVFQGLCTVFCWASAGSSVLVDRDFM